MCIQKISLNEIVGSFEHPKHKNNHNFKLKKFLYWNHWIKLNELQLCNAFMNMFVVKRSLVLRTNIIIYTKKCEYNWTIFCVGFE